MNKEEKDPKCPKCSSKMKTLLQPIIKNGKIVTELPHPKKIRQRVIEQLKFMI
jgi:hypothetical protein